MSDPGQTAPHGSEGERGVPGPRLGHPYRAQLIARIHAPSPLVRRLISQLLADVGKEHPQALIYPLTVASKSQSVARKSAALAILDRMRQHSATLVDQVPGAGPDPDNRSERRYSCSG